MAARFCVTPAGSGTVMFMNDEGKSQDTHPLGIHSIRRDRICRNINPPSAAGCLGQSSAPSLFSSAIGSTEADETIPARAQKNPAKRDGRLTCGKAQGDGDLEVRNGVVGESVEGRGVTGHCGCMVRERRSGDALYCHRRRLSSRHESSVVVSNLILATTFVVIL